MAADIASGGQIFFNGPGAAGGLKQLFDVKDFTPKDEAGTKVVTTIGQRRGRGYQRKQGGFMIDMSVYQTVGKSPEVDWRALVNSQADFVITTQVENNGARIAYSCRASKVDEKEDSEGNYEFTIELACTDAVPT